MSNLGKSILDILWEELDSIVDRIMDDGGEPRVEGFTADHALSLGKEWGEQRGQAQGVAYAVALLTDPLAPDVPAVRELAMARYDERQADQEAGELIDGVLGAMGTTAGRLVHTALTAQERRDQAERDVT